MLWKAGDIYRDRILLHSLPSKGFPITHQTHKGKKGGDKMKADTKELKGLFPVPSREELIEECSKDFPFATFGASGGFGFIRRELINAVMTQYPDQKLIERKYYELVVDGLEDMALDEDQWGGPCPHTLIGLAEILKENIAWLEKEGMVK